MVPSNHLLLPSIHGIVNVMHVCIMFVMRSSIQPKTTESRNLLINLRSPRDCPSSGWGGRRSRLWYFLSPLDGAS